MSRDDEADYDAFVSGRLRELRRIAYLLCHDWHAADDLVSGVLLKVFLRWRAVRRADDPDAYVRAMLTNSWIDETRRRNRRKEQPVAELPEPAAVDAVGDDSGVGALLRALGPRQRAVVVLRYYCDLSVEQTADVLGISAGTVKSQSARGLENLRAVMSDGGAW